MFPIFSINALVTFVYPVLLNCMPAAEDLLWYKILISRVFNVSQTVPLDLKILFNAPDLDPGPSR